MGVRRTDDPHTSPPTFDECAKWAKNHWGLTLTRGDKTARGYWKGAHKTGLILSGRFPGDGHSYRRYPTLTKLAEAIKLERTLKETP